MKITAEPRSDQWNADDFVGGPRTFTIAGVKVGTAEQKYDIELVEGDGRSWRPPLTMLRLLIAAWGDEASQWTGRRVTLYRDESVRFGSDAVGGIRISHLSHLPGNKPLTTMLTSTRGRRARHVVEPLPDEPAGTAPVPLPERVTKVLTAFKAIDITEAQIVAKLGKPRDQWDADDVAQAGVIYTSITKGGADKGELFPVPDEAPSVDVVLASTDQLQDLAQTCEQVYGKTAKATTDWRAWVNETTGRTVAADKDLTRDEAEDILALLAAKDAK